MVKLLVCPVCHEYIHILKSSTARMEHGKLCIDEKGDVKTVDMNVGYDNYTDYECPHCGYSDIELDVFVHDQECECEHLAVTTFEYDHTEMDVCDRCGLITECFE